MNSFSTTRRGFIGGAAGFALHHGIPLLAQDAKPKKSCIALWMEGGPSQVETFDPKAGALFKPVETAIKGVSFSEHLSRVAKRAGRLCVVRSVTSSESDHVRGSYLLHTGRPQGGLVVHPAIGSVAAHFLRRDGVPGYVMVQCARTMTGNGDYGPGFLGASAAPLIVDRPEDPAALLRELDGRVGERAAIVEQMNAEFRRARPNDNSELRAALIESARRLKDSVVERALDLRGVDLGAYAPKPRPRNPNLEQFGPACLVAKRLVAAGVPFVEVVLGGWDTHGFVAESVEELLRVVDPAMSALLDDVDPEGTLVVWMGEFGRTPWLNAAKGRDHYAKAFSAVLAGGGAARGRVVGETDAEGREIVRDPVSVPDLFATIVHLAGVEPDTRYAVKEQGVSRVGDGRVVKSLLR